MNGVLVLRQCKECEFFVNGKCTEKFKTEKVVSCFYLEKDNEDKRTND